MKRLICFFRGHQWERFTKWHRTQQIIRCERCGKKEVVL